MTQSINVERKRASVERERQKFTKLLAENLNYFGTFPETKLKVVKAMKSNTKYEELTCIGLYPERNLLKATLIIKLPYGYGGDLCSPGSFEHVRFYVDWDGDNDFSDPDEDVGMVSLNVHDIPGNKPLEYSLTLRIDPDKKSCKTENILRVRGILSWKVAPPPNSPDFDPVWGNRLDVSIQIEPSPLMVADVVAVEKIAPAILANIDINAVVSKPKKLSALELRELYKEKDVPEYRLNIKQIAKLAATVQKDPQLLLKYKVSPQKFPKDAAVTIGKFIENIGVILEPPKSVKYEELKCVGLNYDSDTLAAVLTVKLPYGYSGNLCTQGSQEYVAFWADWNNDGVFEDYLGTASVNVHDIQTIPPEGLQYAGFIPVDLVSHRRPCEQPQVVRIRAVLSWETPPPPGDPDWNPIWGNKIETWIQIKPGVEVPPGVQKPFIDGVGGMAVASILPSGYADGISISGGFTAQDSPFGGVVKITGHIANAPNISEGAAHLKYKVLYRRVAPGETFQPLANKFRIWIDTWDGTQWTQDWIDQMVDAAGYYLYREDLKVTSTDPTQMLVVEAVLGQWLTAGLEDGLYEVKIVTEAGEESNVVRVRIDNTPPKASLNIETVAGSTAGPCAFMPPGTTITGKFTASDDHFGRYSLVIEPPGLGGTITPVSESYPALPAPGRVNYGYTLDTTGMQPCGYILRLRVWDRTIVNSGYIGKTNWAVVGFCVTAP